MGFAGGFPDLDLNSLPEFMDFILFGKTILVVNKKFGLFLANQLRKRVEDTSGFSGEAVVIFGCKEPVSGWLRLESWASDPVRFAEIPHGLEKPICSMARAHSFWSYELGHEGPLWIS